MKTNDNNTSRQKNKSNLRLFLGIDHINKSTTNRRCLMSHSNIYKSEMPMACIINYSLKEPQHRQIKSGRNRYPPLEESLKIHSLTNSKSSMTEITSFREHEVTPTLKKTHVFLSTASYNKMKNNKNSYSWYYPKRRKIDSVVSPSICFPKKNKVFPQRIKSARLPIGSDNHLFKNHFIADKTRNLIKEYKSRDTTSNESHYDNIDNNYMNLVQEYFNRIEKTLVQQIHDNPNHNSKYTVLHNDIKANETQVRGILTGLKKQQIDNDALLKRKSILFKKTQVAS